MQAKSWTDDLVEIICDVSVDGRRAVRGWRADGAAVARVGSGVAVEVSVIDPPGPARRPHIDRLSRVAATLLPVVAGVAPSLGGSPADVVGAYVQRFKNEGHFAVFPRAFGPSFRHHFRYEDDKGGWASWVATGRTFLSGFPDVQVKVVDLLAYDEWVIEHNIATGTHQGLFRGRAATGRVVTWREIHVYRVRGGRIMENWPTVDFAGLVGSIG
jgi:predicted ester cyclase